MLIGGIILVKESTSGLAATARSDRLDWGLYILVFFYYSALASGVLVLIPTLILLEVDFSISAMGIAAAVSFGLLLCSIIIILIDLGKPFRSMNILIWKNVSSPLTWDLCVVIAGTVLNLIYVTGLVPSSGLITRIWSSLCLMAGVLLILVHIRIFSIKVNAGFKAHQLWSIEILVHSLWGGAALIILSATLSGAESRYSIPLIFIITVFASALLVIRLLAYVGNKAQWRHYVIATLYAITFLLLFTLYLLDQVNTILLILASALIFIIIFLEKYRLIIESQLHPVLPLPYSKFDKQPAYKPAAAEWLLTLGSIGFCILISTLVIFLMGT